ncbi:hypothetical protein AOLI_G00001730 [Acnodon oligacanthus]
MSQKQRTEQRLSFHIRPGWAGRWNFNGAASNSLLKAMLPQLTSSTSGNAAPQPKPRIKGTRSRFCRRTTTKNINLSSTSADGFQQTRADEWYHVGFVSFAGHVVNARKPLGNPGIADV